MNVVLDIVFTAIVFCNVRLWIGKPQNPKALPGPLVLLAADAGAGWVPLGPTTAKAGRKVATVYEDPR